MKLLYAIPLLSGLLLSAQDWRPLFNGKNLDGWEVRGDAIWSQLKDGTLIGQRPHPPGNPFGDWPVARQQYRDWAEPQAWLYSKAEFDQFDLHVEYWIPPGGNSGVSIRDSSRGRYALQGAEHDSKRTPSHIGYEIQIIDSDTEKYPTGSIYLFVPAKTGVQHMDDWNTLDIESRHDMIRVRVNGQITAEHAGDPERSKTGPIGLQLHDRFSWVMFRNIRLREIRP
jgi:hypothetical protein